jgi:CDP-glycerol glycerophosphotransferase (TagB/SpsB family)
VADRSVLVPAGATAVIVRSARWFEVLATSRFVITSHWLPGVFKRRPGQVVVQTWHGSQLKLIGSDRPKHQVQKGYVKRTARQVGQWSFLLSQSEHSTAIFRQAYGYRGTILESGYPRDDALSFEPSTATLDRIRRRLGVPAGDRIVLYAPTFRDGVGRMVSELDHEALVRALGPGTTLLIRGHRYTVKHGGDIDGDRVVDVTTYPDVTDLYLIADVCVTDYSSLMFDFTITGKPILFFVPDLAEYRDTMRGTYFDLGEVCPGPMLTTTDQLVEALQSLPDLQDRFAQRYADWQRRFHPHDDGHAASRVVDTLLEAVASGAEDRDRD